MSKTPGETQRRPDDSPLGAADPLILLVDDDRAVRHSLALMLRASGFRVTSFACAAEMLSGPLPEGCDLLLVDYLMPGMDGLSLVSRLRDLGWTGAALLITGRYDPDLSAKAGAVGIARILDKPLDKIELLAAISAMAGGPGDPPDVRRA